MRLKIQRLTSKKKIIFLCRKFYEFQDHLSKALILNRCTLQITMKFKQTPKKKKQYDSQTRIMHKEETRSTAANNEHIAHKENADPANHRK